MYAVPLKIALDRAIRAPLMGNANAATMIFAHLHCQRVQMGNAQVYNYSFSRSTYSSFS